MKIADTEWCRKCGAKLTRGSIHLSCPSRNPLKENAELQKNLDIALELVALRNVEHTFLKQALSAAKESLRKYGGHLPTAECVVLGPCTCGWAEVEVGL